MNRKIYYSEKRIDEFFVQAFLKSYRTIPKEIILDLDVTDDPLDSWSRRRRVIGKAEYLGKGENPRFVVTDLARDEIGAQQLYFSSLAYVLLKIGAQVRVSIRRVSVSFASSYPYQGIFFQIFSNLKKAYPQLC